MALYSPRRGGARDFYPGAAAPYISREGLTARRAAVSDNSGEVQLQIDALEAGFAEDVTGLRKQVRNLKNVAEDIKSEAMYPKNFIDRLQGTMTKGWLGVKSNLSRLKRRVIKAGLKHLMHVVVFALLCLLAVYLCVKFL